MLYPIKTNTEDFKKTCTQFLQFGKLGTERIQIKKSQLGYSPSLTSSPGWIERILHFFGFKKSELRLKEVAHFSLEWLKAHALNDCQEFTIQLPNIRALGPLMKKAGIEDDFHNLLSETKKLAVRLNKATENIKESFSSKANTKSIFQRYQELFDRLTNTKKELEKRLEICRKYLIPSDFKLHWPEGIADIDQNDAIIRDILAQFIMNPGAKIARSNKSKEIVCYIPTKEKVVRTPSVKIDFYIAGSIPKQRIIVKTNEVIGEGGERKVKSAFDLLSGEKLASKPFSNVVEKFIIQHIHANNIKGFVPLIGVREKRFYEVHCQTLDSYFTASPEVRYQLIKQLVSALKILHDLVLDNLLSYTYQDRFEGDKTISIPKVHVYHGDLKPGNILVYPNEEGQPQAVLSDLGALCQVTRAIYTLFYKSPEKTNFLENKYFFHGKISPFIKMSEIVEHHLKFGQTNDIWSMGLVLIMLLSNGRTLADKNEIPDLDFLRNVKKGRFDQDFDAGIKDIKQKEVDQSIDKLMAECKPPQIFKSVWCLVKLMLKVNPEERCTATQASQLLGMEETK